MKNTNKINAAIALSLILVGANVQAQGTYGGGGGILINGAPELIDAHMNCEWNTVYGLAQTLPKFQAMMSALEKIHPTMAIETKVQMLKTPVCMANGTYFKKIVLNVGPDFVVMRSFEKGPQLAVRWFLDSSVYPDEVYVDAKEFARLPEDQRAALMFHEVFHSFVPRDGTAGRDLKISSLGNAMLNLLAGNLTREELEIQLVQARVSKFSTSVDSSVDQHKTEIQKLVSFGMAKESDAAAMKTDAIAAWSLVSSALKSIKTSFSLEVNQILTTAEKRIFGNADAALKIADLETLQIELDQGVPAADINHDLLMTAINASNEKAIMMILDHPLTVLNPITRDQQLNRVVELGLKTKNTAIPVLRYLAQIKRVSETVAILALVKNAPSVIQVIVSKAETSIQIVNAMAGWIAKHPGALLDQTENMVLDSGKAISELNAMGLLLAKDSFNASNESVFTKVLAKIININGSLDLQDNTLLLEIVRSPLIKNSVNLACLTQLLARPDLNVNQTNAMGEVAFQIAVDQQRYRVAGEIARHSSFDFTLVPVWLKDPKRTWNQNKQVLLTAVSEANIGMLDALAKAKYFNRMDWLEVKTIADIQYPNRLDIQAIIQGALQ
jgi:hypothetical protein